MVSWKEIIFCGSCLNIKKKLTKNKEQTQQN
ncbi:MAG: hypothetical protein MRERC_3c025 [Mycoplasmataceae bacterium RC_NB112A]|nr:MAG: hypothetical protein MRERC_3c025 [Mycoplasmataceae bacterium RC_NB112A]